MCILYTTKIHMIAILTLQCTAICNCLFSVYERFFTSKFVSTYRIYEIMYSLFLPMISGEHRGKPRLKQIKTALSYIVLNESLREQRDQLLKYYHMPVNVSLISLQSPKQVTILPKFDNNCMRELAENSICVVVWFQQSF